MLRNLAAVDLSDAPSVGAKAARLGMLLQCGFRVPPAFVLTVDEFNSAHVEDLVSAALSGLGDVPVAVRSSAENEDSEEASFAGQFASALNLRGAADVTGAVKTCWASAEGARVSGYRPGSGGRIAVLIQKLVPADVAGVALTANPITGARDETIVSAVRGLGDTLVGGESAGEKWTIREGHAACESAAGGALTRAQALEVAALAARVQAFCGGAPQDIEWAIASGELFLLQARPMTALPEQVRWDPPLPGGWMRNFRLGELLTDPVTPLFESWAIERIERRFLEDQHVTCGLVVRPPMHVVVNGWYFHSPFGAEGPSQLFGMLLRKPRFFWGMVRMRTRPDIIERSFIAGLAARFRTDILPRYRARVAAGEHVVQEAETDELIALVDSLADLAGEYLWSISMVGGFAWKTEGALTRFYRRHLRERVGGTHQALLCGVEEPRPPPPHAVESIDWFRPTWGELSLEPSPPPDSARLARTRQERARVEASCRAALRGEPRRLARFETLLALSRKYATLREEQLALFTLGWPLFRKALLRLGELLVARGSLVDRADVFFLRRAEIGGRAPSQGEIAARRATWQGQRHLAAPLLIGTQPGLMKKILIETIELMRTPGLDEPAAIEGQPASPGRATGPVRILHEARDSARLRDGDVLVVPAPTPAFTPLFARAAAVVADGGSVAAHASLVAREYGIPAVVATGDATLRLRDGQRVTVDGSRGTVETPA